MKEKRSHVGKVSVACVASVSHRVIARSSEREQKNKKVVIPVIPQAAQAHYFWVRGSEVIWSDYTRIIRVLSDAK